MVPQGEDAQSNSPIVESAGSSSPDLVSGEQTGRPRRPAAPVPCEGGKEPCPSKHRLTSKKPTKWRRTECRQTKTLVSCVTPAGFVCFYPQDKPRPLISQHLSVPGRDLISLPQWRKSSLPDDDQANSKPGFRRLRLSRAATKPLGRSRGRLEVGTKPQDAQRATQPMRRSHLESYSRGSAPSVVAEGRDQTSERMGGWDWLYPYCVETERASLLCTAFQKLS